MQSMKPMTWTNTKANTPERYAAIITDAVNLALFCKEHDRWPVDHEAALRTLVTLNINHD